MVIGYRNRLLKQQYPKKYEQLLREVPAFISREDSIRIYRISGRGQVTAWGIENNTEQEDIILV